MVISRSTLAPKSNTVVACSPNLPLVVSNHMSSTLVPISGITSADTSSPRSFCREKKIASGKPLMLRSEFRMVNSVSSVSCARQDANHVNRSRLKCLKVSKGLLPCNYHQDVPCHYHYSVQVYWCTRVAQSGLPTHVRSSFGHLDGDIFARA